MRNGLYLCALAVMAFQMSAQTSRVQVLADEIHQRVDVTVDGTPFTAYLWGTAQKKPVLYPLIAPNGVEVSRGYPLAPREGERTDHPHHAGMWFSYGNVDGFDFWNNSDAITAEERGKMGTIHHRKIVSTKDGAGSGELTVEAVWTDGAGSEALKQTTRYVFSAGGGRRAIDEIVTLQALRKVVFHDDKEGMLGIRVARFLESPNEKGGTFTDAFGRPTAVRANSVAGASGQYLTSEGKHGDDAWGTRGRWCTLSGETNNKALTIAIIDHPRNPNYPTYWHARGYGLFAANPLGQHIFDTRAPELDFVLEAGQRAVFRHRVLLLTGAPVRAEMDKEADDFAATYK